MKATLYLEAIRRHFLSQAVSPGMGKGCNYRLHLHPASSRVTRLQFPRRKAELHVFSTWDPGKNETGSRLDLPQGPHQALLALQGPAMSTLFSMGHMVPSYPQGAQERLACASSGCPGHRRLLKGYKMGEASGLTRFCLN